MTHIQAQNWRKCASYVPQMHTSHIEHPVLDVFNVFNNYALFTVDKNLKKLKKANFQFMILKYL